MKPPAKTITFALTALIAIEGLHAQSGTGALAPGTDLRNVYNAITTSTNYILTGSATWSYQAANSRTGITVNLDAAGFTINTVPGSNDLLYVTGNNTVYSFSNMLLNKAYTTGLSVDRFIQFQSTGNLLTVNSSTITIGNESSPNAQGLIYGSEYSNNNSAVFNNSDIVINDNANWGTAGARVNLFRLVGNNLRVSFNNSQIRTASGGGLITMDDDIDTAFFSIWGTTVLDMDGMTLGNTQRLGGVNVTGAIFSIQNAGFTMGLTVNGNVSFINNIGAGNGAGVMAINIAGPVTFTGSTLFMNNSTGDGGSALLLTAANTLTFGGMSSFINNVSGNFGGAIALNGASSVVNANAPVQFVGNLIFNSTSVYGVRTGGVTNTNVGGGAMYLSKQTNANFNDSVLFNNNSVLQPVAGRAAFGGAIDLSSEAASAYTMSFSNGGAFTNNYVYAVSGSGYGGAIYANGLTSSTLTLASGTNGLTFSGNAASGYGGAIYLNAGVVNINANGGDVTFTNNLQQAGFTVSGSTVTPTGSGTHNAIYMAGSGTLNLIASGTNRILFNDPIASATNSTLTLVKSGNGEAVFSTYANDVRIATNVQDGLFHLLDGVTFGNNGFGTTNVTATGTLAGAGGARLQSNVVTVSGGGAMWVDEGEFVIQANSFTLGNSGVFGGSGTLTVTNTLGASVNVVTPASGTFFVDAAPAGIFIGSHTIATTGSLWITPALTGGGKLVKRLGGTYVIESLNSYSGGTEVQSGVILIKLPSVASNAIGSGTLNILSGGTVAINPTAVGAYSLNNAFSGAGVLDVNLATGGDIFAPTGSSSGFMGTAILHQSTYTLQPGQFRNATLVSSSNNKMLSAGVSGTVANFVFSGGTVQFDMGGTTARAVNWLDTGTLSFGPPGVTSFVQIDPAAATAGAAAGLPILQQDDDTARRQLINAVTTVGDINNISVVDMSGAPVAFGTSQTTAVVQNYPGIVGAAQTGTTATGYYTISGLTGTGVFGPGLYLVDQLTRLDLIAGKTTVFNGDTAVPALGDEFHAQITGGGNLWIAAANAITLNNSTNSYTGVTTAASGTLILGANNVLGNTSLLSVLAGATGDLNGMTQALGSFTSAPGAVFYMHGGTLTATGTTGWVMDGVFDATSANSVVNSGSAPINIGRSGAASVLVGGNASISTGNLLGVGTQLGGTGTLAISGSGNVFAQFFTAGLNGGAGTVLLTNSGSLTAVGPSQIGLTGTGSVTVSDSAFFNAATALFTIGSSGTGALLVQNSGSAALGNTTLGSSAGGSGTLTVRDNARLTTVALVVGNSGTGVFSLSGSALANSGSVSIGALSGGNGSATVAGNAVWNTSGVNSITLTGTAAPAANAALTIQDNARVSATRIVAGSGSSTLTLNGGLLNAGELAGSPTAVVMFNGGTLQANQSNSAFINGYNNGALVIGGSGAFVDSNGLNIATSGTGGNGFTGAGALHKIGSGTLALSGSSDYSGGTQIENGSLVITTTAALGTGAAALAASTALYIAPVGAGNFTLANTVTGPSSALLDVNLFATSSTFAFAPEASTAGFSGTALMRRGTYTLTNGDFTNATLVSATAGKLIVGTGSNRVATYVFGGGTTAFDLSNTGSYAAGWIRASALTITSGAVQVDPNNIGDTGYNFSLLTQDDIGNGAKVLAQSDIPITGDVSSLQTVDINGNAVNFGTGTYTTSITQNNGAIAGNTGTVAIGTYSGGGLSQDGTHIYFDSGILARLDLQAGKTTVFDGIASQFTPGGNEFHAQITGSGNLWAIAAGSLTINASPLGANTYTGTTTAASGTLVLGTGTALGFTVRLVALNGATVDINGKAQGIGAYTGSTGSQLLVHGGTLTGIGAADWIVDSLMDATAPNSIVNTGSSRLIIGNTGTAGALLIASNAIVTATSGNSNTSSMIVGNSAGALGTIDISGGGRLNTGALTLLGSAASSTASVHIGDNAVWSSTLAGGQIVMGGTTSAGTPSTVILAIDGQGALNTVNLYMAAQNGSLTLSDSAAANISSQLNLGISGGSASIPTSSIITIQNSGSLFANGAIIGRLDGTGTIFVKDNGRFNFNSTVIGQNGSGALVLSGTSLTTGAYLIIGSAGVGTLNITQSSTLQITPGGSLTIAQNSGNGTLLVRDNGVLQADAIDIASPTDELDASTGTLTLQDNARVTTNNIALNPFSGAALNLNGGLLQTSTITGGGDRTVVNYSGEVTFNSGTLQATGNSTTLINGIGALNILAGGAFIDTNGYNATIGGNLNGFTNAGMLHKIGSGTLTLNDTNSSYLGGTQVEAGALVISPGANTNNSSATLGSGTLALFANSAAYIAPSTTPINNTYTLGNALAGASSALLDVNLFAASNTFAITGNTATFTGTANLHNAIYTLRNVDFNAATLISSTNNKMLVSSGSNRTANLTLSGGTVQFNLSNTGAPTGRAQGWIDTGTLDLGTTGTSYVQIDSTLISGGTTNTTPLLQQDDTAAGRQLINATALAGNIANIALVDLNGNAISATSATSAIQQNYTALVGVAQTGTTATGYYTAALTTTGVAGTGTGLYLSTLLTRLDLLANKTTVLTSDTTTPPLGDEFHAQITGSGNLYIAATKAITISNSANTYTGTTTAGSGTLIAGTDNALGKTTRLDALNGSTVDMNGKTQTIGYYTGSVGAVLRINGGILTGTDAANSWSVNGLLDATAANSRILTAYNLIVGNTIGTTGTLLMASNAAATIGNNLIIGNASNTNGTALLRDNATLNVTSNLTIALSGTGALTLQNSSTVNAGLIFIGQAGPANGTLALADNARLNVTSEIDLGLNGTATITLADNATLTNAGPLIVGRNASGKGTLNLTASSTLTNAGTITLGNTANAQAILTVTDNARLDAQNNIAVGAAGTGTLTLNNQALVNAAQGVTLGATTTGTGNLTLNGGALQTTYLNKGVGTGTTLFNGGTLRATTNADNFLNGFVPGNLSIAAGGAYIDTNGYTIGTDTTSGFTGNGALTKLGTGTLTLNSNSDYTGGTQITQGAILITTPASALGTGTITIAQNAALLLALTTTTGTYTLANDLAGTGLLDVNHALSDTNAINLTGNAAAFTGTASMRSITYTLANGNFTNATLITAQGNHLIVGTGSNHTGNFTIDGGEIYFDVSPNAADPARANGWIDTGTLTITNANGNVKIDPTQIVATGSNAKPLLQQDDGAVADKQLINATALNITGSLMLVDLNGNPINPATTTTTAIVQNDATIAGNTGTTATGYYGGIALTQRTDGLYIGAGALTRLDLLANKTTVFASDTNTPPGGDEFHAQITGSGALYIIATNTITLTGSNSYTGGTIIHQGTLLANNPAGNAADALGAGPITYDNNATASARLLFNTTGTLTQRTIVTPDSAGTLETLAGQMLTISTPALAGDGGAVFVYPGGFYTNQGKVTYANNQATLRGGALFTESGTLIATPGATLTGNTAAYGAAAAANDPGAYLELTAALFTSNTATRAGGAIYASASATVNLATGTYIGNYARDGGAIAGDNAIIDATGAVFTSNTSTLTGGAISLANGGTLTAIDAQFQNNTTAGTGGAIDAYATGTPLTINLGATANHTSTYTGNTDATGASSITLSGDAPTSTITLNLSVAAGGTLAMLDPIRTDPGNAQFTITANKTGPGIWILGGTNTLAGTGGNNMAINDGALALLPNAALYLNTNAAGTMAVNATGTLTLALNSQVYAGNYTQAPGSVLQITTGTGGPAIIATTGIIADGARLDIAGFTGTYGTKASELSNNAYTFLHTTTGITGNYAPADITLNNGATTNLPDYLSLGAFKSTDNHDYNITYALTWNTGTATANGNFTLANPADTFEVDIPLADQNALGTFASGWNGQTLTKLGPGTLILSAANTYTGLTTVSEGKLTLNGSIVGDAIATAATLAGTGTIGGTLTIAPTGTLAPGDIGIPGTIHATNLNMAAGSITNFDIATPGAYGGTGNDLIALTGTLAIAPNANLNLVGTNLATGLYHLITYNPAAPLTNGGLAIDYGATTLTATTAYLQTSIAGEINLINLGTSDHHNPDDPNALVYWDGDVGLNASGSTNRNDGIIQGGNGTWQAFAGNDNWTLPDGTLNAGWRDTGYAVFGGLASGTVVIDDSKGAITASGLRFTTDGYVLTGTNLTLTGTDNAQIDVRTSNATIDNALTGTTGVEKLGPGTLTLNGENTYTGTTTINAGQLYINGSLLGDTTVSNATLLGGTGTLAGTVKINAGGTLAPGAPAAPGTLNTGPLTLDNASNLTMRLGQTGTGPLNDRINTTGALTLGGTLNTTLTPTGTFGGGIYRLIDYTGTLTNNTLVIGQVPTVNNGENYFIQTRIAGQVNLVYLGGTSINPGDPTNYNGRVNYWDGLGAPNDGIITGGDGIWQNFASNRDDWTTQTGTLNAPWQEYTYAIFSATGGTITVDNSQGQVMLGGADFTTGGYTINGDPLLLGGTTTLILNTTDTGTTTINANLQGNVDLAKNGIGTLILGGTNDYTGTTTVNAGRLLISGSTAGAMTAATGATLGGNGHIGGNVTINDGATIQPGTNNIGILHIDGNLNLAPAATLDYEFGKPNEPGLPYNDLINVTGSLVLNGTLNITENGAGYFGIGEYRVINYAPGTLTDNTLAIGTFTGTSSTTLANLYVDTSRDGQVNLLNTGGLELINWDGGAAANKNNGLIDGGPGTWQGSAQGANINWTEAEPAPGGTLNAHWADAGFAIFGGLTSGTVTVDATTQGPVIFAGAQFKLDGYVLTGAPLVMGGTLANVQLNVDGNNTATINNTITGTQNLQKYGGGTLILNGTSTYTGQTLVDGGLLQVNGLIDAAGSSTLSVNNTAALGGTGTIGSAVNINPTGTLAPGNLAVPGTITVGALTVNTGAHIAFDLATPNVYGGTGNDLINTTGSLTLANAAALDLTGTNLATGLYHLITYNPATTLTYGGLVIDYGATTLTATTAYVQTSVAGQINLINTGTNDNHNPDDTNAYVNWDGDKNTAGTNRNDGIIQGGNGTWQAYGNGTTATSQGNDNWTLPDGTINAPWKDGGYAVFGGLASGTVTIDDSKGTVNAIGLRFTTDGYVLTGTNLTLTGTDNAQIDVRASTATINNALTGTTGVEKLGPGTLTLNGVSTYTGLTTITAGKILVNGSITNTTGATAINTSILAGNGTLTGPVTINTGATLAPGDIGTPGTLTLGALTLAAGSHLNFDIATPGVYGGSGNDLVAITGSLAIADGANLNLVGATLTQAGIYHLITYSPATTLAYGGFAIDYGATGMNDTTAFVQTSVAGEVNLIFTGTSDHHNPDDQNAFIHWDGDVNADGSNRNDGIIQGGNGTWQAIGSATSAAGQGNDNWTQASGALNAGWQNEGFAVFGGLASGTVVIDDSKGAVIAYGLRFTTDGYLLTGTTLNFTGTTDALIQTGTGTLIASATINASISGTEGLIKTGPGTLELNAANTYTGTTTVNEGKLTLNGSVLGAMTVTGTSILAGTGTIAGTTAINANATLAPGDLGKVGNLHTGALTFDNAATLAMDLGQANTPGGPLNDLVTVNGALTLGGTLNVAATPTGTFGGGLYRLIDYTGALTNNTLALGATPTPNTGENYYVQTTIANQVNLFYYGGSGGGGPTPEDPTDPTNYNGKVTYWDGNGARNDGVITGGNGTWQAYGAAATGYGNDNWTVSTGTLNAPWQTYNYAHFTAGGGTVTVDNSKGPVTLGGADITVSDYVIQGDAILIGGTSSIIINTANTGATTIAAALTGTAGITKTGEGTLDLTGASTYTGVTTINEGRALIDGAITSNAIIATAATLGGNGIITGNATLANGATLQPGSNGAGLLTITGNLALANGSNLDYQLGQRNTPGGTLNDLVNVGGNLTLGGTLNITETPGGAFGIGEYRLINYAGALTDNTLSIGTFTGTSPVDLTQLYVDTTRTGQVNLVNRGGLNFIYWDGGAAANKFNGIIDGGNGVWQGATGNNNWTIDPEGDVNARWLDASFAIFGGNSGTVTIDGTSQGPVVFAGAQFQTDGYLLTGGTLYMGGTTASIQLNVNPLITATIASTITGTQNLQKYNDGTLVLTGNNTYTGETQVQGGTLLVNGNIGGSTNGAVTVNNATLGGTGTIASAVTIATGTLAPGNINQPGTLTITNTLTLADTSHLAMQLGQTGTGTLNDLVHVDGALNLAGQLDVTLTPTGSFGGGAYRLIDYTGPLTDNTLNIGTTPTLNTGQNYYIQTGIAGQVNLFYYGGTGGGGPTPENPTDPTNYNGKVTYWDGNGTRNDGVIAGGNGTWQAYGTGSTGYGNDSWTVATGTVNAAWQDYNYAHFTNTPGTITVDNSKGQVTLGGAIFTTDGYVITGAPIAIGGTNAIELNTATTGTTTIATALINGDRAAGITKTGAGVLNLSGQNTYTGPTTVTAGKLLINGSIQGNADATATATLGGTGTIAGLVSLHAGATLTGGDTGAAGNLHTGALTLDNAATLAMDLGQANTVGGALNDLISVNGALVLGGTLNVAITPTGTFVGGAYRLIDYTGTLTNNTLALGTLPVVNTGQNYYIQTSNNGQVNLIYFGGTGGGGPTPEDPTNPNDINGKVNYWDGGSDPRNNGVIGGGNGTWQAFGTGSTGYGNDNWTTSSGTINAPWQSYNYAIFTATGGLVQVDNNLGQVIIGGASFTVSGYTIQGGGIVIGGSSSIILDTESGTTTINSSISGTSGIFKTGVGTLILGGTNTYGNNTQVTEGTLAATNVNAVSTGSVAVSAGATFEYRNIASGTTQNIIGGSGTLSVADSRMTLDRANTIANVTITRSNVTQVNASALGGATATLTINSGTLALATNVTLGHMTFAGTNPTITYLPPANPAAPAFKTATITSFDAGSAFINMNIDFTKVASLTAPLTAADYLNITGNATGTHTLALNALNTGTPAAPGNSVALVHINSGNASFTLPGGVYTLGSEEYQLAKGDGSALRPDASTWYLFDGENNSGIIDIIVDMTSLSAADWYYSLDALYQRMGDLRQENLYTNDAPADHGAGNIWVRSRGYQINALDPLSGNSFRQYGYGVTAGADKSFVTANATSLIGVMIDMGGVSREFHDYGTGNTTNVAIGLYATWLHKDGWYVDMVAKADHYQNDFTAHTLDAQEADGHYSTQTQGLSLEAGRIFKRHDGWWIEPSLQAAAIWLNGTSYDTTPDAQKVHVKIDSATSQQYRAQLRFGRQFFSSKWYPYAKVAAVAVNGNGGTVYADTVSQTPDYNGKRVEFGFGTTYKINNYSQFYLDYEYAKAALYERPWSVNFGYRRLW